MVTILTRRGTDRRISSSRAKLSRLQVHQIQHIVQYRQSCSHVDMAESAERKPAEGPESKPGHISPVGT